MNPLEFLIFFMLLTLLSSFFIVGFYGITRYYIEIQPDGKEEVKGYIGKWWSYYFEYVTRYDKKYYFGETLVYKFKDLKHKLHGISSKLSVVPENTSLISFDGLIEDEIFKIETVLQCKVEQKGNILFLYIEEPIYLFPAIIRKPLSQCVKCMASFWGGLIWITINYLYNPFTWTNHKLFAFFVFFGIFVITLSLINDFIFRKTL